MDYSDFAAIKAQVVSCHRDAVVLEVFENETCRGRYTVARNGDITPAPGKYESILVALTIAARKGLQ